MNASKEKTILVIIGLFLGYSYLPSTQAVADFIFRFVEFLTIAGAFTFMALIWVGNPQRSKPKAFYWKILGGIVASGWLVSTAGFAVLMAYKSGEPLKWWYIVHPAYLDNMLESILPALIIGGIYGYLRKLIISGRKDTLKKVLAGTAGLTVVAAVIFGALYIRDTSWEGNEDIRFLDKDQQIQSVSELLDRPELKGKKVYVDLWYSSCSPCIKAFRNMEEGKSVLDEEGYVTLYLGRETSHQHSKQLWINTIKDYKLEGWHVYMSDSLRQDVWSEIGPYVDRALGYPHYMLVNENGEITDWDAPNVSDAEALREAVELRWTESPSGELRSELETDEG